MDKIVDELAVPVFKCKDEKLSLTEIVRHKKVVAVTIKYQNQNKEEIIKRIEARSDIQLCNTETEIIIIRIREKSVFTEIESDYSENSIHIKYVSFLPNPYQFNLPIERLVGVEWI
jgi:uncharacterized pyridoxamine 5'-phosphate oxidase family protein